MQVSQVHEVDKYHEIDKVLGGRLSETWLLVGVGIL